jgi:hypothetical protein
MTLNTAHHGTDIMRRLEAMKTPATTQQLAEFLGREDTLAITEQDLRVYIAKEMRVNVNSLQHMMTDLGWTRHTAKWGSTDYARAIWVAPQHRLDRGSILALDGSKQAVCDVLWASE